MGDKLEAALFRPASHLPRPEVTPGFEAECEAVDCEDRIECEGCGVIVCPLHSPEASLSECVDGGWHHQDDCEDTCPACAHQAFVDYWTERADAKRKGDDLP